MRDHQVAAVIPVVDEVTAIGELVTGLRAAGACCAFVVDGGSTDGTPDAARAAGGIVVDEPRRGYGRACLTGADRAAADHPVLAFLDGDGSCDPADLPRLVAALDAADLVLGARARATNEPRAMPWHAAFGNRLVAGLLRLRTGRTVHDLPPFKVVRRRTLSALDMDDTGYGWTAQLIARALRSPGVRVVEAPATFRRRRGGQSKVSGSPRASYAAGRRMLACAITETTRRPLIALMAKAPRAGHAKTRLAADIGQAAALDLWAACLSDLGPAIRSTARSIADTIAVVPGPDDVEAVAALLGPGWPVVVQSRPGLGGAITHAFATAVALGADRALAVSGDNPTLPPDLLSAALAALDRSPAVLGPSEDGGYHLVGVKLRTGPGIRLRTGAPGASARSRSASLITRLERVFSGASLGGASALRTTAGALAAEGIPPRLLAAWPDVDTAADLASLAVSLDAADREAPRTRAWLAEHAELVPAGRSDVGD